MISLRQNMDKLARDEKRFRVALQCYLATLGHVAACAVEVSPDITGSLRVGLRSLIRDVSEDPESEAMEHCRDAVASLLSDFQMKAAACQNRKEEDLRAMLSSMADAVGTLAGHGDRQSAKVKQFAVRLHLVSKGNDLAKIREDIAKQVAELRDFGTSMAPENCGPLKEMQTRLNEFQERLEQAEQRASTDALTGLVNRGEGESRLKRQISDREPLSVLMIDLNGFKQINDRWGHPCGDQVLRSFAGLLANNVRALDMVCRWGGDEFLVVLRCTGPIAQQRAGELRARLTSQHKVGPPGRTVDVVVGASVGVAESREGESWEDLIARADSDLYSHKSRKGGREAPKVGVNAPVAVSA